MENNMKRGTLYAVGVGPGKAGHLTLLAAETLRACPVIAAPRTGGGHMLALEIAQKAVPLADLTRQIQDMIDEISNDLLQTNAKDFATQLGDSLVEAFKTGEDAAKAMETTVNEVLQNIVVNQLKKKFLENQLQGAGYRRD